MVDTSLGFLFMCLAGSLSATGKVRSLKEDQHLSYQNVDSILEILWTKKFLRDIA